MTYLGTYPFFKDFQDDLGISPLRKGFPYDENYMPAKIVYHWKTVSLWKLLVSILNQALSQTLGQDQLIHSFCLSLLFLSPSLTYIFILLFGIEKS